MIDNWFTPEFDVVIPDYEDLILARQEWYDRTEEYQDEFFEWGPDYDNFPVDAEDLRYIIAHAEPEYKAHIEKKVGAFSYIRTAENLDRNHITRDEYREIAYCLEQLAVNGHLSIIQKESDGIVPWFVRHGCRFSVSSINSYGNPAHYLIECIKE